MDKYTTITMCRFPDRKVHTLFHELQKFHRQQGTDPTSDYAALRELLTDRSIVHGNMKISQFLKAVDAMTCTELVENVKKINQNKKELHRKNKRPYIEMSNTSDSDQSDTVEPESESDDECVMIDDPAHEDTTPLPWMYLVDYKETLKVSVCKLDELLEDLANDDSPNPSGFEQCKKLFDDNITKKRSVPSRISVASHRDINDAVNNYTIIKRKTAVLRQILYVYENLVSKFEDPTVC